LRGVPTEEMEVDGCRPDDREQRQQPGQDEDRRNFVKRGPGEPRVDSVISARNVVEHHRNR